MAPLPAQRAYKFIATAQRLGTTVDGGELGAEEQWLIPIARIAEVETGTSGNQLDVVARVVVAVAIACHVASVDPAQGNIG